MTGALNIELIRGLHNLRPRHRGCVLTVGKFDGLHRGHQVLMEQTRAHALEARLPSVVMSFDPSPREFFSPQRAPLRISTLRDKLLTLQRHGIDRLLLARFDQRIADIPAPQFLEGVLLEKLGMHTIIVGDDLRFGQGRAGDIGYLQSRAEELGYRVVAVETVSVAAQRASSSALREALAACDFDMAERLLGHPYRITGRVRRGLQLGRQLDMPTANITVREGHALPLGIYAVRASSGGQTWNGVASLGVRPTLGLTQCLLETHLFDAQVDLYGQVLEVRFHHHLRPELRFDSMQALKAQMHEDAARARTLLNC